MATRSSIAYTHSRGVTAIYAHWDGYPTGVGACLVENYQAAYKINQLIMLGDVSIVAPNIGKQIDFDDREAQAAGDQCLFYGRDRGETGVDCKEFETIPEWIEHYEGAGCEYFYLWNGKEWLVSSRGNTDDNGFPIFDLLEVKIGTETARLKAAGYL